MHFIDDIASKLNLERPKTNWLFFPRRPSIYLRKLKRMNKNKTVKNEILEKVRLNMLKKANVEIENDDEVK